MQSKELQVKYNTLKDKIDSESREVDRLKFSIEQTEKEITEAETKIKELTQQDTLDNALKVFNQLEEKVKQDIKDLEDLMGVN